MPKTKIAISLDSRLLKEVDHLVKEKVYPNRSKVIQEAVREKLLKINRSRLAKECAKLDVNFEQSLAEEGFSQELKSWPEY